MDMGDACTSPPHGKRLRTDGGAVDVVASAEQTWLDVLTALPAEGQGEALMRMLHRVPREVREQVRKFAQAPGRLNPVYTDESLINAFRAAWDRGEELIGVNTTEASLFNSPFTAAVVPDILAAHHGYSDELLATAISELKDLHWNKKNNDLYYFYQTNDLKTCDQAAISAVCAILKGELRTWMERATGMALHPDKVDIFAARYPDTGTLLCHDDRLEGRRIAFILYLSPGWRPEYGGGLDLFATDGAGGPGVVARTIVPTYNTLAFFRVSARSFHQVAEVTAPGHERWSITGWYHARDMPTVDPVAPHTSSPMVRDLQWMPLVDEGTGGWRLEDWINPDYIRADAQAAVRDAFLDTSNTQLQNFLRVDRYAMVVKALHDVQWERSTAALQHRYGRLGPRTDANAILHELSRFLQASPFIGFLREITQLKLKQSYVEVQRFGHGDYTLLHDDDPTRGLEVLEAQLCVLEGDAEWPVAHGGAVTYLGSQEELLTIPPSPNALSLVFRDPDTMGFVKYINHHAKNRQFVRAMALYSE